MKLKWEKELTDYDIEKSWDLTQELFDIYTESEEVKEMTVKSELIGGVLTTARALVWTVEDISKRLEKTRFQKGVLFGTTVVFGSYYIYNEFIKDGKITKYSKLIKKVKE